jgi:uncharacterized repeat protein (TIGR03806 family)
VRFGRDAPRSRRQSRSPRRAAQLRWIGTSIAIAAAVGLGAAHARALPPERVPWNESKIAGTPDLPPPYTVEPAFPHLTFRFPVVLVPARGTDRLFVGELPGRIYSFPNDTNCTRADLALDVASLHPDLTMFYGITFHPRFDENRYIYVCYVLKNDLPDGSVVSRFEVSRTDPPVIDPKSERVILTFWSGGHNGGCLDFGTDGYLYISTGDAGDAAPPDARKMTGQDCSDLLSSILRIDVDQSEPGKAYRIPPDNPFVTTPGVRPEIWAFGFRNPWRMSIDRATGDLWVGDVGWELWEMVDKVKRGGNYGWSVMEGPQPVHVEAKRGPTPILAPTLAHPHSEAASITGGYIYHGTRLPELAGAYIYGDYQTGTVWGLRCPGETVTWKAELARTPVHLAAFGVSNAGELYLVDHDRTHQIYRLARNPAATARRDFPRRLSETGLFASTRDHRPAAGVVPYSVHSALWADGATAERFLAIPGTGRIGLDERGNWRFPEGSVLVRTVSVPGAIARSGGPQRVETQILHFESDAWRPYTYVWDDLQADAILADAQGTTRSILTAAPDAPHGRRQRNYRIYARSECILCHNPWVEKKTTIFGVQSASPLGINTAQMNKLVQSGRGPVNQLQALHGAGLLAWTPDLSQETAALQRAGVVGWMPDRVELPSMVDPYDESADLARRARSYLQTNCSHCHQFNAGGAANIALGIDVPLQETKTVDIRPIQGTFQIAGARIIAPGDPSRSVLYYRVSKLGGGRMPRAGSSTVDDRAVRLVHDWIARMPAPAADAPGGSVPLPAADRSALDALARGDHSSTEARSKAIRQLAATTRGALLLLGLLETDRLPAPAKPEVLAITRNSPAIEVRDLFERFIPEEERVKRLGDVVDRASILKLAGDPGRGRDVFAGNPAAQCKNCHKAGGTGETVGPDLTKIGTKYDRAALLDQILEPSRTIEPQYVAYQLETKDGRVIGGLVMEKNAKEVILKDAQRNTVRVPAEQVEQLVPQSRSLMPELLLRDLTPQQVADLLEYLTTLR